MARPRAGGKRKPTVGARTTRQNQAYVDFALNDRRFRNRFSDPKDWPFDRLLTIARMFYGHTTIHDNHEDRGLSARQIATVAKAWRDPVFKAIYAGGQTQSSGEQLYWAVQWDTSAYQKKRAAYRRDSRNEDFSRFRELTSGIDLRFDGYDTRTSVTDLLEQIKTKLRTQDSDGNYPVYVLTQGNQNIAFHKDNIDSVINRINNVDDEELETAESDTFLKEFELGANASFTIARLGNRGKPRNPTPKPTPNKKKKRKSYRKRNTGAFFPYLHTYEDIHLKDVLNTLGVYTEIDASNYDSNCLCLALAHAGVHQKIVQDIESTCLMRQIPRKHIRGIAERYNLYITIQTVGSDHLVAVGPIDGLPIRLGLLEGHYFHDYKTDINSWGLIHYDEVKHKPQWWRYSTSEQKANRGIQSLKLLNLILKSDKVSEIDLSTAGIYGTQFYDRAKTKFKTLEFPEEAIRLCHPIRGPQILQPGLEWQVSEISKVLERSVEGRENLERLRAQFIHFGVSREEELSILKRHVPPAGRVFFDFETTTDGFQHSSYMVCWATHVDNIQSSYSLEPGLDMLQWVLDELGGPKEDGKFPKVVFIAHNVTYDAAFILQYLEQLSMIEKGVSIICGGGVYRVDDEDYGIQVEFKDSQKMIAGPLKGFTKDFGLGDVIKEVMPYSFYNEDNIVNDGVATFAMLQDIVMTPEDRETMMDSLEKLDCIDGDCYDMMKYAEFYCKADIRLLMMGWAVFREDTLRELGMDPNYFVTTASMADFYIQLNGCYDGVYEISGVIQEFIKRCAIGGRVMVANNQPVIIDTPLADLDVNSLYPSAMITMSGYLKGPPKIITDQTQLASADGYYALVKIKNLPQEYPFPITCLRNEINGKICGNHWTNDLVGKELYLDKTTLDDLCLYCSTSTEPLEYEVVQGYYFDEGFNPTIRAVMRSLFQLRCRLKLLDSTAQLGVKLLMNSTYGKTGLKSVKTDVKYIAFEDSEQFIHNHHNSIKSFTEMPNGCFRFVVYKTIDQHFNKQHLACGILSRSKSIMNRVMCMAHKMEIPIWYTDTDSIHIDGSKIQELADAYSVNYQQTLLGDGIAQFHSDFTFKSCFHESDGRLLNTPVKSTGVISTKKCYFLGKKSYMDVLSDESGQIAYHIRLKGIPSKCIMNTCNVEYGGKIEDMFQDLFDHKALTFNLGRDEHVMFKVQSDHSIRSIEVHRTIRF